MSPKEWITIDVNIFLKIQFNVDVPRSKLRRKGSFVSLNSNPTFVKEINACLETDCKRASFKRNLCKRHFIKSVKAELQK